MTAKPSRPDPTDFDGVTEWVFDLDNTLYPRRVDLFSQIDRKMTGFIRTLLDLDHDAARKLQKQYYRDHGTTLQGLMINHGIDANEFLLAVHDIDYSVLAPDPALSAAIKALPGRKFIFTNGDVPHARRTAEALGILDHFDDIFDIIAADLMPKPAPDTYRRFLEVNGVHPERAAMFEDLPRNLAAPHELGMRTVLVVPDNMDLVVGESWEQAGGGDAHVHYVTDDLRGFLAAAVPPAA